MSRLGDGPIVGGEAAMDEANVRIGQQWKSRWEREKGEQDVGGGM